MVPMLCNTRYTLEAAALVPRAGISIARPTLQEHYVKPLDVLTTMCRVFTYVLHDRVVAE